jgi:Hemolysin-type calcium-binding repeat (2 copies).
VARVRDFSFAGAGDDSVDGGADDDTIDAGEGEDAIDGGEGDDVIDLGTDPDGTPDGDVDTVIVGPDGGDDVIENFDAPVLDNNGQPTGPNDLLDVSGLLDDNDEPVDVDDVTVTTDSNGDSGFDLPEW